MTKAQRRNAPHESDAYVPGEDVVIRHGQANHKLKKHGHDFGLPYYENESGWKKTPRTPENLEKFKKELVANTVKGKKIEGTFRDDHKVIHYFDPITKRDLFYDADTKKFVSG